MVWWSDPQVYVQVQHRGPRDKTEAAYEQLAGCQESLCHTHPATFDVNGDIVCLFPLEVVIGEDKVLVVLLVVNGVAVGRYRNESVSDDPIHDE